MRLEELMKISHHLTKDRKEKYIKILNQRTKSLNIIFNFINNNELDLSACYRTCEGFGIQSIFQQSNKVNILDRITQCKISKSTYKYLNINRYKHFRDQIHQLKISDSLLIIKATDYIPSIIQDTIPFIQLLRYLKDIGNTRKFGLIIGDNSNDDLGILIDYKTHIQTKGFNSFEVNSLLSSYINTFICNGFLFSEFNNGQLDKKNLYENQEEYVKYKELEPFFIPNNSNQMLLPLDPLTIKERCHLFNKWALNR